MKKEDQDGGRPQQVACSPNTIASARDPVVVCHVGLLLLHAITAKEWHSPTGSRMQQVLSSLDVLVHGH